MKWIASTLCKVCIHSCYAFVALNFFVDLMFIQWESQRKKLYYFPSTVISKCRKWYLRGTYLKLFPGAACHQTFLEAHTCDHGHGYAGSKTAFFLLSGLESLKLAFLKFNLNFNSAALWIIQLQTHQAPGVGHFLLFPAPHGGVFAAFCALLKLLPTYIPGWGGSGFTLTGA